MQGSRDGFAASDFHNKCDNKGATLTLIQSTGGYIFGGYTNQSWNSSGYVQDAGAFIFTLKNPHNIPPTKYTTTQPQNAIRCYTSYGPMFGSGDIYVYTNSNQNTSSSTSFPQSYGDSTGKGKLTFTNNNNFQTTEIEVFQIRKVWVTIQKRSSMKQETLL